MREGYLAALTTDLRVPAEDPDDYYDVACAVALGFHGVVLDDPHDGTVNAVHAAGARALQPRALRDADAVAVAGACTNAARHYRRGQRVIVFAGDVQGLPEFNEQMDPDAYRYLLNMDAIWVPCFDGGAFEGSERASWTLTNDADVIGGTAWEPWFRDCCGDVWGTRSLYCGAYLAFTSRDRVAGSRIRPFRQGFHLAQATRRLLAGSQPSARGTRADAVVGTPWSSAARRL